MFVVQDVNEVEFLHSFVEERKVRKRVGPVQRLLDFGDGVALYLVKQLLLRLQFRDLLFELEDDLVLVIVLV